MVFPVSDEDFHDREQREIYAFFNATRKTDPEVTVTVTAGLYPPGPGSAGPDRPGPRSDSDSKNDQIFSV
jgi:hypothetical protein